MKKMRTCREDREVTLADALADPLVQAVMKADRVDRHELEKMLGQIGSNLPPSVDANLCSAK